MTKVHFYEDGCSWYTGFTEDIGYIDYYCLDISDAELQEMKEEEKRYNDWQDKMNEYYKRARKENPIVK